MCNYADDNIPNTGNRDFHKLQEYLKKTFKKLGNWFYGNHMVLNPRKCEFMGLRKINENEYLPITIFDLKKLLLRNYLIL